MSLPHSLKTGDRIRLVLGGPVFRVARVTAEAVSLTPEVARIRVESYGRRFSVTAEGLAVSTCFVPAELLVEQGGAAPHPLEPPRSRRSESVARSASRGGKGTPYS